MSVEKTNGEVLGINAAKVANFFNANFWLKVLAESAGFDQFAHDRALVEIAPDFDAVGTKSNLAAFFLGVHILASAVTFEEGTSTNHPNPFVRRVAAINDYLDKEPQSGIKFLDVIQGTIQAVNVVTAPLAIHSAPDTLMASGQAIKDLATTQDHSLVDVALISFAASGTLHIIRDFTKIYAKIAEVKNKTTPEYRKAKNSRKSNNKTAVAEELQDVLPIGLVEHDEWKRAKVDAAKAAADELLEITNKAIRETIKSGAPVKPEKIQPLPVKVRTRHPFLKETAPLDSEAGKPNLLPVQILISIQRTITRIKKRKEEQKKLYDRLPQAKKNTK